LDRFFVRSYGADIMLKSLYSYVMNGEPNVLGVVLSAKIRDYDSF